MRLISVTHAHRGRADMELDHLDRRAIGVFDGSIVRKDLARKIDPPEVQSEDRMGRNPLLPGQV